MPALSPAATTALREDRMVEHDGKLFLAFGLSPEAARALLVQLADCHGLDLVPKKDELALAT